MSTQLPLEIQATFRPEIPGAYAGLPAADYHRAPGISKSALDRLHASPLDYQRWRAGLIPDEQTEAMLLGRLFHALVLENRRAWTVRPDTYGPEEKPWNGNATLCKEWLAAHADEDVISSATAVELEKHAAYIRTHAVAGPLLRDGLAEVSVFARQEKTGKLLKGRLDYVRQNGEETQIIDLKRMVDASTRTMSREILNRRYHVQAAMYRRILQRLGVTGPIAFILVGVEYSAAPKVNVRRLAEEAIDAGERALNGDLDLLRNCSLSGRPFWPEYPDSCDEVATVDLPEWVYAAEEPAMTGLAPAAA